MTAHPSTRLRRGGSRGSGRLVLVGGGRKPELGEQDRHLVELVSHGLSDEQIGVEVGLSGGAVRREVDRIVESMDARNRTHAVALALKSGLID